MSPIPWRFVAVVEFEGWPIEGEDMAERVRAAIENGPYSFRVEKVTVRREPLAEEGKDMTDALDR